MRLRSGSRRSEWRRAPSCCWSPWWTTSCAWCAGASLPRLRTSSRRSNSAMDAFVTALLIALLFGLLGSGLWIGLSLLGVAWIGMELFTSRPVGDAMAVTIWGSLSSWTLTALPLFVWMGEILFRTKLSEDMFKGLAPWLTRIPGRLLNPEKIPAPDRAMSFGEKVYASRHLIPVVGLIALVLGSIYVGIATATEAAALGVVGALVLSLVQGSMSRTVFMDSIMGAT